jgi:hypothetical protein
MNTHSFLAINSAVIPQNFLFDAKQRKKIYAESQLVFSGTYQMGFRIKPHFPADAGKSDFSGMTIFLSSERKH